MFCKYDYIYYRGDDESLESVKGEILRIKDVLEGSVILDLGDSEKKVFFDDIALAYIRDIDEWRIVFIGGSKGFFVTMGNKYYFKTDIEKEYIYLSKNKLFKEPFKIIIDKGKVIIDEDDERKCEYIHIPKTLLNRVFNLSKKIVNKKEKYILFSDYLGYYNEEGKWYKSITNATKFKDRNIETPVEMNGNVRWNIY